MGFAFRTSLIRIIYVKYCFLTLVILFSIRAMYYFASTKSVEHYCGYPIKLGNLSGRPDQYSASDNTFPASLYEKWKSDNFSEIEADSYNPHKLFLSVYHDDRSITKKVNLPSKYRIPPILHVQWKSNNLTEPQAVNLRKWRQIHPNWTIILWTDSSMSRFVQQHFSEVMTEFYYNQLPSMIHRVDFMRYILMNIYGGIYADLDVEPVKSLQPLINSHSCVIAREPEVHPVSIGKHTSILAFNGLLMSRPGHPFWTVLIESLLLSHIANNPVDSTGPVALTEALKKYESLFRFTPRESSVFLAPSIYFFYPPNPRGDGGHISLMSGVNCAQLIANPRVSPFEKRLCCIFIREKRLDYSDMFLHPRHFWGEFTRHHMSGTWLNAPKSNVTVSVRQLLPDVLIYGENVDKFDSLIYSQVSPFEFDKKVVMKRH